MADDGMHYVEIAAKLDELSREAADARAWAGPILSRRFGETSDAARKAARALRELQAAMDRANAAMDEGNG